MLSWPLEKSERPNNVRIYRPSVKSGNWLPAKSLLRETEGEGGRKREMESERAVKREMEGGEKERERDRGAGGKQKREREKERGMSLQLFDLLCCYMMAMFNMVAV